MFISTAVTEGNYSRAVAYSSIEVTEEEGVVLPEGREKERLGGNSPTEDKCGVASQILVGIGDQLFPYDQLLVKPGTESVKLQMVRTRPEGVSGMAF